MGSQYHRRAQDLPRCRTVLWPWQSSALSKSPLICPQGLGPWAWQCPKLGTQAT